MPAEDGTAFEAQESVVSAANEVLRPVRRPHKVYHHCRRLRKARDRCLEEPSCLACLLTLVLATLLFFCVEAWWLYTRRWPGRTEQAIVEAPKMVQQRFEQIGCYPLVGSDAGANASADVYEYSCMQRQPEGSLCRSGLPFYVYTVAGEHTVSWRLCSEFCLLKGFDVSGVVDAAECRCGASADNKDVWRDGRRGRKRPDLHWQPATASVAPDSDECRIVAARYVGPMPIPRRETDLTDRDLAYVASVMLGVKIVQLADSKQPLELPEKAELSSLVGPEDDDSESEGLIGELVQEWSVGTDEAGDKVLKALDGTPLRSCYPFQCAAGIPWPVRTVYASGIPYAFEEDVPESTRSVFRAAITAYHAATCILFNEVSPSYDDEYKIIVKDDEDGCFTSPVGYPLLYKQDTEINLGWCNSERQIGNMIHELGHAMGMAHEHMRPDRDEFVHIDYAGMSPLMHAQYAKDPNAYVGSAKKGTAPYDYGSLMHYPATSQMRTLPLVGHRGVHDAETGQRRGFSVEDVKQLRDMYQCDNKEDDLCLDMDKELGAAISLRGKPATCYQVRKYCKNKKFGKEISYFCPKTCNSCGGQQTTGGGDSDGEPADEGGCVDRNQFCERYKAYCPQGLVPGEEQWMATHCRATCRIPKYCGGSGLDMKTPQQMVGQDLPQTKTCIDSSQTGLMNALGQVEGCAGLEDRCRDPTVGSQVRSACPATCGLCHEMPEGTNLGELKNLSVVVTFELAGEFYDLTVQKQEDELANSLAVSLRDLYRDDVSVVISHFDSCASPCKVGHARLTAQCCVVRFQGCTMDCEELRDSFLRYDAPALTKKLAGRGHAGIEVDRVVVSSSVDHVFNVLFTEDWVVRAMTVVFVASVVCLFFAVTRARCFLHPSRSSRRLRTQLESDLLESDSEQEAA